MTDDHAAQTLVAVVERLLPFASEKIWHALTQPSLIEAWLMKNDFQPVVGHHFNLRADWGVVDGQVLIVEQNKTLSYTCEANDLNTVVTWTLIQMGTGTQLRVEQSGFQPSQQFAYQGAQHEWHRLFANLEQLLARID